MIFLNRFSQIVGRRPVWVDPIIRRGRSCGPGDISTYMKKIAVIGNSGFAKEIIHSFPKDSLDFFISGHLISKNDVQTKPIENLDFSKYKILLAIGDPNIRKKIVDSFPLDADYITYVDKHARILNPNSVEIGKGTVICAGSIITSDVKLGDFSQINLNSTIGHDCNIGNFFTCAPGVHISGNVNIKSTCYFGTNTAVKNNLNITNDVTVGMNSNVIKDVTKSGVYVGNPLKKIK